MLNPNAISESPLHHYSWQQSPAWPGQPRVNIEENALLGYLNIRGTRSDSAFTSALSAHLQISLPASNNTASSGHNHSAYWLGPDEYLLVLPGSTAQQAASTLHAAWAGQELSVVELSGAYTQLRLTGDVRSLLARGCPLDLHSRAFAPGQCAQSHIAKAPVLIHCVAADEFRLIVRRSFATYLAIWLDDARR